MTELSSSGLKVLGYASHETPLEAETRLWARFPSVEARLRQRFAFLELPFKDAAESVLGKVLDPDKPADPETQIVWVLDNTAFQEATFDRERTPHISVDNELRAEFVACFFYNGEKHLAEHVAAIAGELGLDGVEGVDAAITKRIEERVLPFIHVIAPGRTIRITLQNPSPGAARTLTLGPSNLNGVSCQILATGSVSRNGKNIPSIASSDTFPNLQCQTHLAAPIGWMVISDIDDTIKITGSVDPITILRTTFTENPRTTPGMPEFYNNILNERLHNPAWFYLSASPYNLYPFLHSFLQTHYPHGTMILRDSSWMYLGGLLQSLTQGVQAYKVNRMHKIHSWLPLRSVVCVGDSTQSDPEAYAEIYKTFPGWVKAIFIRKVVEPPVLKGKNDESRFLKAFEGVSRDVWRVFTDPRELVEAVEKLTTEEFQT